MSTRAAAVLAAPMVVLDRRQSHPRVAWPRAIDLELLGSFRLVIDGREVDIPHPAQRLLALLAVHRQPMLRAYAAGTLWLDMPEDRAGANLRSALWRLRTQGVPVVRTRRGAVGLLPSVRVDAHEVGALARRWLAGTETEADLERGLADLEDDLLPDWYEDWIADARERHRQLRVHALERIADRLAELGRWGDSVQAALAAVAADPLRESAHRALISIYLAEGNVAAAVRQLRRCERIMIDEVGVRPSFELDDLAPRRPI